jgi:hypothetical protein
MKLNFMRLSTLACSHVLNKFPEDMATRNTPRQFKRTTRRITNNTVQR